MTSSLYERVAQNPFYVLEIPPSASRSDVERAGQRLLALLGIQSASATRYTTPLGELERDAELVRTSLARLRDPRERVLWELWASEAPELVSNGDSDRYDDAPRLWGWRHPPWYR